MSTSDMLHPRIAYVEMDSDIRDIIIEGLQKNGFAVNGYDSAESFLPDFKPGLFDLIISNLRLPKIKGFELYREIKRIDPKQKCLFLSAFLTSSEEIKKSFPDIDCPFVRLPISMKSLVSELHDKFGIAIQKAG